MSTAWLSEAEVTVAALYAVILVGKAKVEKANPPSR